MLIGLHDSLLRRIPKSTFVGGYVSESGFRTSRVTRDYANGPRTRPAPRTVARSRWWKTHLAAWADEWIDTVDVEPRTEENYRSYLRNHSLPPLEHHSSGRDLRARGHHLD